MIPERTAQKVVWRISISVMGFGLRRIHGAVHAVGLCFFEDSFNVKNDRANGKFQIISQATDRNAHRQRIPNVGNTGIRNAIIQSGPEVC